MDVLNSIIKFDLHIHSAASKYKEASGIVDNSTKENLDILFSKLQEHNVALFSITDHNRFDAALYEAILEVLNNPSNPYTNVRGVLPGIEFDVVLDPSMEKCHIIGIFDANNKLDNFQKIENAVNSDLLREADGAYTKSEFEELLKTIGLSTILIAAQRKDPENKTGHHNSLSDSTTNFEQVIRVGYINALEFQKPKMEGILINRLNEIHLKAPLFSGSDCHDWECYPYHDKNNQNIEFHHSKARMLPTFKGLLMAVTSPETRFDLSDNQNTSYIEAIIVDGKQYPLVNGINAIIGENGSGKSTILDVINKQIKKPHVKAIAEKNKLYSTQTSSSPKIKYITQNQIITQFNANKLFSDGHQNNFKELDNQPFIDAFSNFNSELKKAISLQIDYESIRNSLDSFSIIYDPKLLGESYYISVHIEPDFSNQNNDHEKYRMNLIKLIEETEGMINDSYYNPYVDELTRARTELKSVSSKVDKLYKAKKYEITVKTYIHREISEYMVNFNAKSSARDKENVLYQQNLQLLINRVVQVITNDSSPIKWPIQPKSFSGSSQQQKRGFYFNKVANYHDKDMIDDFLEIHFIKNYASIENLKNIKNTDELVKATKGCTSEQEIDSIWGKNLKTFLEKATINREFITEGKSKNIGNTLGEMSLAYYKYYTQDHDDWHVLIIDQPEDNISNNNVSKNLVRYLNDIRDKKQLVFVTHNPLLVVNLDVDNVIFVTNDDGVLRINQGCLEYESETINILDLIANNMDGGKESIEKRLKLYGKNT